MKKKFATVDNHFHKTKPLPSDAGRFSFGVKLQILKYDIVSDISAGSGEISPLEETLRWGQPAYLTPQTGVASTLRLGPHKQASFAIFAHCRSNIITSYAQAFPGWDRLDGNRAVLFDDPGQIEPERLSHLIRHALSYHL